MVSPLGYQLFLEDFDFVDMWLRYFAASARTKKLKKQQEKGLVSVSLFNGISTLFRLFNAKPILLEEQQWYYLTHSWEDKGVHTFPKGICLKVNVIAQLE